ncbi:hypothetical protein [Pseudomonas frederiksbergensis]|uniref:hypothetical protein n=1 Tax=Pseudomonas frederiksbergensis TaxID=104087 RepID=UPI002857540F|nr:hypothetical protein [Pseudomonas frederiksbergensis]MDR7109225.1 hypothetical protein [Pseudomonas frederiksbergensis]
MSALRKAQIQYDNLLPPPVSEDDLAEIQWLEANAENLIRGSVVSWGIRADRGEVSQADLYKAVQDHVNQRQIDGEDKKDALGQLVIAALGYSTSSLMMDMAIYLLGSKTALKDIALELLKPHAAKAVAFQEEQDRLEQRCGF